jgi:hypothetical protein
MTDAGSDRIPPFGAPPWRPGCRPNDHHRGNDPSKGRSHGSRPFRGHQCARDGGWFPHFTGPSHRRSSSMDSGRYSTALSVAPHTTSTLTVPGKPGRGSSLPGYEIKVPRGPLDGLGKLAPQRAGPSPLKGGATWSSGVRGPSILAGRLARRIEHRCLLRGHGTVCHPCMRCATLDRRLTPDARHGNGADAAPAR